MKVVLHRRLAAILLLMVLLGANAAAASVCEVCCAIEKSANHHDQMEMTSMSPHHHPTSQHHMAGCPACSKSAGLASRRPPDCATLQRESRVFSGDRAVRHVDATKSLTGPFPAQIDNARFSAFHAPPNLTSFDPLLVSLRI